MTRCNKCAAVIVNQQLLSLVCSVSVVVAIASFVCIVACLFGLECSYTIQRVQISQNAISLKPRHSQLSCHVLCCGDDTPNEGDERIFSHRNSELRSNWGGLVKYHVVFVVISRRSAVSLKSRKITYPFILLLRN